MMVQLEPVVPHASLKPRPRIIEWSGKPLLTLVTSPCSTASRDRSRISVMLWTVVGSFPKVRLPDAHHQAVQVGHLLEELLEAQPVDLPEGGIFRG